MEVYLLEQPKNTKAKLALGVSLIVLGIILLFGRPNNRIDEVIVNETFASEPVEVQGFDLGSVEESKPSPNKIIVPSVSIDLEVKDSQVINGYWEVYEDTAGWGEGSGYPGEIGNQVIFAHAREGLFLPLREVAVGDAIYILSEDTLHGYKVEEIKEVTPDQIEVIAPTEDETLTLYTCSGYADSKRLIVVAKPLQKD